MEDAIRERVPNTGKMKVICRTGDPIDPTDILIGRPMAAKSIIVLGPDSEDPDAEVIKTILALTRRVRDNTGGPRLHIVAEIRDERNLQVAQMVGRDDVEFVLLGDVIARIAAQTCLQSGLSVVITELLDFKGNEFYFSAEPALAGKAFAEAARMYDTSTLCGVRRAGGAFQLNPPPDSLIEPGDKVLLIAEDDSLIRLSETPPAIDEAAIRVAVPRARLPERSLILGWNKRGAQLINELDTYSAPYSIVHVVAEDPAAGDVIAQKCASLAHTTTSCRTADTTDRRVLDALEIASYRHIILLCADDVSAQRADARALITLLHLRDIAEKDETPFSIISEMLDLRNRELAEAAKVDDFIVSEHLVSLMLAQLSENPDLLGVFTDMFDPEGAEIYLKPIGDYVEIEKPVNFYTITEAAKLRGETAIGYRLMSESHDAEKAYGVHTNPKKSEKVLFKPEDKLIVISEG